MVLKDRNNKIVLVQIGRNFYTLNYKLSVKGTADLKKLIDSKKYNLQLLAEEDE